MPHIDSHGKRLLLKYQYIPTCSDVYSCDFLMVIASARRNMRMNNRISELCRLMIPSLYVELYGEGDRMRMGFERERVVVGARGMKEEWIRQGTWREGR